MMKLLLRWAILAVSVFIAAHLTNMLIGGFRTIDSVAQAPVLLVGVAALALANATLGKLVKLLTLPLNCLTLGLFSLVVNALVLMLVGSLRRGFEIDGFLPALVGSVLISIVNGVLGQFVPDDDREKD